jgi:hypothetical protein
MTRYAALVLGIVAAVAMGGLAVASADAAWAADPHEQPKKSVAAADVYYGDAARWQKPAEVDPDAVYAKIDEYKEIVDQGLKPGDAKYEILIGKASKRFTCAVKKAAKDGKYDLVARTGAVKGVENVPDITTEVVAKL